MVKLVVIVILCLAFTSLAEKLRPADSAHFPITLPLVKWNDRFCLELGVGSMK